MGHGWQVEFPLPSKPGMPARTRTKVIHGFSDTPADKTMFFNEQDKK